MTAPLLMFAVFGPAAGKLADLRGQKRVYLWSLVGVGVFFVQWFPSNILAQFALPVVVAIVFSALLIAMFREDTPAGDDVPPFSVREFIGSFYVDPRKSPDFAKLLVLQAQASGLAIQPENVAVGDGLT